jgi:hypothetical protein
LDAQTLCRLLKNAHLLRFPHPSPFNVLIKYASRLRISGALHLDIFEQSAFGASLLEGEGVILINSIHFLPS